MPGRPALQKTESTPLVKRIFLLLPFIAKGEACSSPVGEIIEGEHVPLGLYYLASSLRAYGYAVKVTDALALRLTEEDIFREIEAFSPSFVGISATTVAFPRAVDLAQAIKKRLPHLVTIIGGRHVSSNFHHAMSFQAFDFGVVGEGEITAPELLDALIDGKPLAEVKGVVYRDGTGLPIYTGEREFIDDLDTLPFPAFDLIPAIDVYKPPLFMYKALPHLSMITSRGCPGQCTFCACSLGKKYRMRSAENIVMEIRHLVETYGIREIDFLDDNFLLDKKRIYAVFDLLRAKGIAIHWTCLARISSVDYEFLRYLRDNGCWNIAFGIESGDEQILRVIKKGLSLNKTVQVVRWCRELGIVTRGFFIIGHPLETLETIERTIDYALSIPLDIIMTSINTPFPGTQQYEEADRYGTLDTSDLTLFSQYNPVFIPHGLTKEILLEKQQEMHIRFFFRPKQLARLFRIYFGRNGVGRLKRARATLKLVLLRMAMALSRKERGTIDGHRRVTIGAGSGARCSE